MSNTTSVLNTSLGRKFLMSITGLFLCSFLLVHMAGNLALFSSDGGKAFNEYTYFMTHNPIIRIMEIVLALGFIIHIVDAVILTRKNAQARPVAYAANNASENSNWYSRNMGLTGTIILVFLIIHLKRFWFEFHFGPIPMDAWGEKDMYYVVSTAFQEAWYVALYVVSMILLGAHLNHGFQSAFQSLGLKNKLYAPAISAVGLGFAIIVPLVFAMMPIAFYFGLVG